MTNFRVRQSSTGMAVSKDRQASSWQFGTNFAVAQCPEEWSINGCSLWSRYECIEASLVLNCISPSKVWALTFVADCYSIRPTVYMLLPSASNDKVSRLQKEGQVWSLRIGSASPCTVPHLT